MTPQQLLAHALGISQEEGPKAGDPIVQLKPLAKTPLEKSVSLDAMKDVALSVPNPVSDVASAMQAVEDAEQGNYGMAALDAVGAVPVLPSLGKFAGMAGIFAGRNAKTADLAKLARAEEMHAASSPREHIWNETGWWKGPDDQWRFEIPDNEAVVNSKTRIPNRNFGSIDYPAWNVGDALTHEKLYEAYPDLATVQQDFHPQGGAGGTYFANKPLHGVGAKERIAIGNENRNAVPSEKQISNSENARKAFLEFTRQPDVRKVNVDLAMIPEKDIKGIKKYEKANKDVLNQQRKLQKDFETADFKKREMPAGGFRLADDSKSTLLHELQHAVQGRSGFGHGGSPSTAKAVIKNELENQLAANLISLPEMRKKLDGLSELSDFGAYKRLLGEAEARLAQKRMNYSPIERALTYPWKDLDVPESELYVIPQPKF